jgi:Cellulose binding domain/Fibronectin type III domain
MRSSRVALIVLVLAATSLAAPAGAAETVAQVTVNARAGLGAVGDAAVGVNHAVWDQYLGTDPVADLMKTAGVQLMRYPGGSYSDIYHWQDNTAPGGYVAPNTDFDHFMAGVQRAGAQAMVIANYGTGTPQEAADWVRYANVTKGYGVKYWEIGNELYGNGHYGANWEADDHPDKSPAAYATNVKEFAQAMKAADPSVRIGAVLTTPGNWPDGIVAGGDAGTWNQVVLSIAGPYVDFVILHWYPGGSTGPEALARTQHVADATWLVRQQIDRYAGGRPLTLAVTEMNTGYGMNTQPGALFAADAYATLLENGVFTVDWWNVHNGITGASTIDGQPDYADFGLLSSGTCLADGTACEPPLNTPFAPYHALAMTAAFARPGDQLIRAGSTDPMVKAHAARRANGDLAVLLINQDPANAHTVALQYAGYSPASTAQVLTFANGDATISTGTGTAASRTLPPYSLTTLILHPTAPLTGPAAPGQPTASAVTASDATISWPAAAGGVKYEIHRQNGTTSEQWGETTGTSFTVHNLTPGTRYTANVITRDAAGRVSWASPPVTFLTGTPAGSDCAVTFTDASDWGNGFVAGIDVTNTGSNPIDSWTLRFTWPTGWQQLAGGWNGNWTQTGNAVQVSNADFNRTVAPGATVNVGFVGAYQGPNVLPGLFTLNGKLCTTR